MFSVDCIVDRLNGVSGSAEATSIQKPQRHDFDIPIDAANPHLVSTFSTNDSRAVGSMTVIVHGIAVICYSVIAVDIVDSAQVAIMIRSHTRRTRPNIVYQIGVRVFDTAIEDGDYNLIAPFGFGPRLLVADIS